MTEDAMDRNLATRITDIIAGDEGAHGSIDYFVNGLHYYASYDAFDLEEELGVLTESGKPMIKNSFDRKRFFSHHLETIKKKIANEREAIFHDRITDVDPYRSYEYYTPEEEVRKNGDLWYDVD